jgi:hypothetical protein
MNHEQLAAWAVARLSREHVELVDRDPHISQRLPYARSYALYGMARALNPHTPPPGAEQRSQP